MTDSLAYSKRIQQSLLPRFGIQSAAIKDHFIFYKPKDIVSGDFYWQYNDDENQRLIVATADCTGHGVPGAFMSIIGKQGLDLAVIQNNQFSPAEILHNLNNHLGTFLQKELNKHITDGMDISIYCIDYSNPQEKILTYSGALNSIYIARNEELIEMKADRITLGYDFGKKDTPFTDQQISLKTGDNIYSYTDGYQDQFGGPMGKKLKKIQLKKTILANHQLQMSKQLDAFHDLIDEWTGDLEQVDDMCIIGVQVN
jgi:serine phosphatase RsbU (regulator of sigma subunit)